MSYNPLCHPPTPPHSPPTRPGQTLVRVLELCKAVLEALAAEGYQLTDYEAQLLLPCVVEKAGHNQVGSNEGEQGEGAGLPSWGQPGAGAGQSSWGWRAWRCSTECWEGCGASMLCGTAMCA